MEDDIYNQIKDGSDEEKKQWVVQMFLSAVAMKKITIKNQYCYRFSDLALEGVDFDYFINNLGFKKGKDYYIARNKRTANTDKFLTYDGLYKFIYLFISNKIEGIQNLSPMDTMFIQMMSPIIPMLTEPK